MPYPGEHAARLKPPERYKRFRRENDKFGKGIHAIWGILPDGKVELQAIRFDRKRFSPDEARKWLEEHNFELIDFEKARGLLSAPAFLERTALLLEAGDYPDKGLSVDEAMLAHLESQTPPDIPVYFEHQAHSMQVGWLSKIWREGKRLFGKLRLRRSASQLIDETGVKGVSVGLILGEQPQLEEVSITASPRVKAAQVFSSIQLAGGELMDDNSSSEVENMEERAVYFTEAEPVEAVQPEPEPPTPDISALESELQSLRAQLSEMQEIIKKEREEKQAMLIEMREQKAKAKVDGWVQAQLITPGQVPMAQALLSALMAKDTERVRLSEQDGTTTEAALPELFERLIESMPSRATMSRPLPHARGERKLDEAVAPDHVRRLYERDFGLSGEALEEALRKYVELSTTKEG